MTAKPKPILERAVKQAVRTELDSARESGVPLWYYMPMQSGMGSSGIPDFVCCIRGRFVGIECKRDSRRKLTDLQQIVRSKILGANGLYYIATSLDVSWLRDVLYGPVRLSD